MNFNLKEQVFFGYILYRDIFNRPHMSRFCVRVFPAQEKGKSGKMQLVANERWRECD
jgi:hypothetical protein